jgi:hypothetical protein
MTSSVMLRTRTSLSYGREPELMNFCGSMRLGFELQVFSITSFVSYANFFLAFGSLICNIGGGLISVLIFYYAESSMMA